MQLRILGAESNSPKDGKSISNYIVFNQSEGIYTYIFEAEKKPECLACNKMAPKYLEFDLNDPLGKVVDYLKENVEYQMKAPTLTTHIQGKPKTLYMTSIKSLEELTRPNLEKSLYELGLINGQEILVTDSTTPNSLTFYLRAK